MAQRQPLKRASLAAELEALRAFADLVDVAVSAQEGKPWDLTSRYWRPRLDALRLLQDRPTKRQEQETKEQGAATPQPAGLPEEAAIIPNERGGNTMKELRDALKAAKAEEKEAMKLAKEKSKAVAVAQKAIDKAVTAKAK